MFVALGAQGNSKTSMQGNSRFWKGESSAELLCVSIGLLNRYQSLSLGWNRQDADAIAESDE